MAYRQKNTDGTTRIINDRVIEPWPVGSVYMSFESTNPGALFGGAWARVAQGRMLVGVNEADVDFDVAGDTGGAKTHNITTAEMPGHSHAIDHDHVPVVSSGAGLHHHNMTVRDSQGNGTQAAQGIGSASALAVTQDDGYHAHTVDLDPYLGQSGGAGGGQAMSLMSPFIAVYIWRRTA